MSGRKKLKKINKEVFETNIMMKIIDKKIAQQVIETGDTRLDITRKVSEFLADNNFDIVDVWIALENIRFVIAQRFLDDFKKDHKADLTKMFKDGNIDVESF